jgi:hypothetical protein
MSYEFKTGTILIRESALLPTDLPFKGESCVSGWKIITDSDVCALDREIRKAGWAFFRIAAEIGESVFGLDEQKMLHRAIERILESAELERFNSLEIAEVRSVDSVRFPGVRYVTVSAHPRHIQQSPFLFANCLPGLDMANENMRLAGGKILCAADTRKKTDEQLREMATLVSGVLP